MVMEAQCDLGDLPIHPDTQKCSTDLRREGTDKAQASNYFDSQISLPIQRVGQVSDIKCACDKDRMCEA